MTGMPYTIREALIWLPVYLKSIRKSAGFHTHVYIMLKRNPNQKKSASK